MADMGALEVTAAGILNTQCFGAHGVQSTRCVLNDAYKPLPVFVHRKLPLLCLLLTTCVCVHVCMRACVHARTVCVCVHACVHARTHGCAFVRASWCLYAGISVCILHTAL